MNTEDRMLIGCAAAAAGISLQWSSIQDIAPRRTDTWAYFNPLDDDGDALRLAVELKLQVLIGQGPDGDITWVRAPDELDIEGASERHGTDARAATRRAIVRTAVLMENA